MQVVGDPRSGTCSNGVPVGGPGCWFNPAAFAFPERGFRGNLGRNTLIGPGLIAYDVALTKRSRVNERMQVELRLEAFNLFNRANLNPPGNTEDGARVFSEDGTPDATGSWITARSGTSTGPRELQLGLRILF
jgi:hypothetical protein